MPSAKVVSPDYEIVVNAASGDVPVFVAGFFIEESGIVDVGIAWDGETDLGGLRALLHALEVALSHGVQFMERSELVDENSRRQSESDELPF